MDLKTTYIHEETEPIYVGGTSATISTSDGKYLVTPLNEDVIITDLETNEIYHKIPGDDEDENITSLCITPNGENLAICSQSQQLRIFNLPSKTIIKTFKLSSPVYISTVDSTSTLFAFGGSDGVVTVWDIEGGYITHSLKGHGTTICSITIYGELNNLKSWKLASGDTMGTVKIWDLSKKKCLHTLKDHNTAVRAVSFNSNGEIFLTGGRDQIVIIYNTKNFKQLFTHPINEQIEASGFIDYIGGKEFFYTGGSNNILRIWNVKSGQLMAQSPQPLKTNEELLIIDIIKLMNQNLYLVISDQTLIEIDCQPNEEEVEEIKIVEDDDDMEIDQTIILPIIKRIAGNQGIIADSRYVGPNKEYLAMATNSPSLRIINFQKPFELKICEGHTDILNALDVSSDGLWIATASKDGEAKLWKWNYETETFDCFATFKGHSGSVTAIAINNILNNHNEPKFIITGSNDLTIKKWNIPTTSNTIVKSSIYTRRAHDKDINSIDISPNDEFFATASYDKLGKIWSVESGETIGILKGHKRGLWDINFYKFDKYVATGSGDKTIKIWSLNDFSCIKTLEGHTNSIQRVKFFNSLQPQLISVGADGLVKIWDFKNEENLKTLDNHDNRIWSLALKDDEGKEFITADSDGKITKWIDNTEEENLILQNQQKEKIEKEQNLNNFMKDNDWENAFLLALTLNHSMKLYNVLKSCIETKQDEDSIIGSFKLESIISKLNNDQLILLFKKIRDWNINFKFFEISQILISVVLKNYSVSKLIEIPGIMKIIDSILPYNERHYNRIDELIEETYVLDYTVEQMNQLLT
ncbi:utp13 [Candida pseudojiufengensis]|uniref:utp13 n=1 Tax=Candida pseudojiufengensis TaxID=497109 RepID=UPI0022252780|nr:utp13 [Candida pseudojiufengensis]KAI5958705.1 utp13 [Candida pseudojiufengensis]